MITKKSELHQEKGVYMFFDPLYFVFVGPAIIFTIWAQFKVKATFSKYEKIQASTHMTGRDVALRILEQSGIHDVKVEEVGGWFSDHYDSQKKVLRLSPKVYHNSSIASVGVAAHEVGHAIQHAEGYAPLMFRQFMAPAAMIGSNMAMILIFLGAIMSAFGLIKLGIIGFALAVIFQLITVPVELDASRRAKQLLDKYMIIPQQDVRSVALVLNAAAYTYLAAALAAVMQLLYFLFRFGFFGSNRD